MKNKILLSLITILLSTLAFHIKRNDNEEDLDSETREAYSGFLSIFHRNFKNKKEFKMRANIFKKKKDMIDKFNKEESEKAGYKMEINFFADLTDEELSRYLGRQESIPELPEQTED